MLDVPSRIALLNWRCEGFFSLAIHLGLQTTLLLMRYYICLFNYTHRFRSVDFRISLKYSSDSVSQGLCYRQNFERLRPFRRSGAFCDVCFLCLLMIKAGVLEAVS